MKDKSLLKLISIGLFLFFTALYLAQATGYYDTANTRKTTMTEDAIRRFEEDVRNGENIDMMNYLEAEKDYHNRLTRLGRGVSSLIEKGFNGLMNNLFREIEKAVNKDDN